MKEYFQRMFSKPASSRFFEWGRLITITGSAQIFIQLIGVISGILIIRLLPPTQYALYTLANTMLGTMTVLSDAGISNGVLAQGGKVWQNRKQLGSVLVTGFELRKKLSVLSLAIALPVLSYLLYRHNAEPLTLFLIILSLVPAFFSALSGSLLQIALTLHQDIKPLQFNQIFVSIGRFILCLSVLFFFPFAFLAILASGIPQIWGNFRLRKKIVKYADWNSSSDPEVKKNVLSIVKRVLPGAIFYCFSGQITIWLISFFGSTNAIAQAGALGRLSVILSVFTIMFNTLVVPRFARLPEKRDMLAKKYLLIEGSLVVLSVFIVLFVSLFPAQILWILGNKYYNLDKELLLVIIGSCLSLIAGISFGLSTGRGWVINPLFSICLTLCAIITGIFVMDFSTLAGVLKFNILLMSVEVIMYFIYILIKIGKIKTE